MTDINLYYPITANSLHNIHIGVIRPEIFRGITCRRPSIVMIKNKISYLLHNLFMQPLLTTEVLLGVQVPLLQNDFPTVLL